MNKTEKILLRYLRENSRRSLTKISKETNIPVSTLYDNLRKLQQEVISKHISLVDFRKVGYYLKVNFVLGSLNRKPLRDFLLTNYNVNSLSSLMNNEYDFFAECVFKNMKELTEFKEQLENLEIKNQQEIFVVEDIKRESLEI